MARASSRSAGLKTYWKTVHAVANRLDKPIKDARAIVREGRAREKTHTELRKITPQNAGRLLKSDRKKAPARFKLKREKDERRAADTSFEFGANVPGLPEPTIFETLDEWIEAYEDLGDDFDLEPPDDYDVTPDYEGKGKGK
jgi:hypothetical protein